MKDFIDTCWFVFKWGLLAALLAAVGLALYFYSRVNDEIRQRVQAKWQEHYPNLVVNVRSAQLTTDGIEIRGLTLRDPHADGPQAELAVIDEIVLYCQTSLPELMQGEPKFARAVVHRPMIHATRRPDGGWSAAQLFPLPKFSKQPIPVTVENGTLEFFDPQKDPTSMFTLHDINLQANPLPSTELGGEPNVEIRGDLAGDHFQHIDVAGTFGPGFRGFDLNGMLTGLDVSPELRDALPSELANRMSAIAPLRGQARIGFHVVNNPAGPTPFEFQVQGQLTGARLDDPRLPSALADLRVDLVDFRANNREIVINDFQARNGPAILRLAGKMDGFAPGAPFKLHAHAERLLLSGQWEPILPPLLLESWHKFLPAGLVNADLTLEFDGHAYHPDLDVRFLNVSVTYHKFPYRLDRVAGRMTLKEKHLKVEVVGYGGSQPIHVAGEFDNPGEHFTGEIKVDGTNLQFDKNLFDALAVLAQKQNQPETCRSLQLLHPGGTFDFVLHNHRDKPDGPLSPWLTVKLNQASVRYEKFAYPISNIGGTLVMTDGHWTFRDLVGTNGPGTIHCDGTLERLESGWDLELHFTAANVPLQDDLRDALNPQVQRVWNNLKPQGAINVKTADLRFFSATKTHQLSFRVEPVDTTTSIKPVMFPYRLERLQGALVYRDGHIDLEGISAMHGRTPVKATGFCEFDRDGNWHLQFKPFAVDHVPADSDLAEALSGKLKKCVKSINPTGAINISGMLEFSGTAAPNAPVRGGWDVLFNIDQGTVGNGIRIENIHGSVRLKGECDGQHAYSRGMLAIDSLTFKDFQFTQVNGPLWIDDKQVLFGSAAEQPQPGQPPHRVTARLYGGYVQADCAVALADTPRYSLQALLVDGDLKRFVHETVPGKQKLDGRVLATIKLDGETTGVHSLFGRGEVRLTQADIYELPFMAALLKILNFKPPTSTAFTNSTIEYRVEGDHVYLEKVAFNGDLISLEGSGELGFDSQIKLTLHVIGGRSDWELPLFKTVMGAASRQLVQIHVTGTLSDPQMTRDVLPAVGKTLQQMQENAQR